MIPEAKERPLLKFRECREAPCRSPDGETETHRGTGTSQGLTENGTWCGSLDTSQVLVVGLTAGLLLSRG